MVSKLCMSQTIEVTTVKTSFTVCLKMYVLSHLNHRKISLYYSSNGATVRNSDEQKPQFAVLSNLVLDIFSFSGLLSAEMQDLLAKLKQKSKLFS